MRTLLVLTLLAGAAAADDADRVRRARVALALADSPEGCGRCRTDLALARKESAATGRPIVLFVGGCDNKARDLPPGAIAVRVPSYAGDDAKDPAAKRVVLLTPAAGTWGLTAIAADAPVAELRRVVAAAVPKPLNWSVGP